MSETEAYRVRNDYEQGHCAREGCGHPAAAHGSKGMICAACRCVQFLAPPITVEAEPA